MRFLALILILLSLETLANPIQLTTISQPQCYGREYSEAHMAKNTKQTVKLLRVKFYKDEYTHGDDAIMDIEALLKRPYLDKETNEELFAYKRYTTGMGCFQDGEQLIHCGIDCDGGSAQITWEVNKSAERITFINKGFVMVGGCGEEELEEIWLADTKGGDDVFFLYALPKEYCQK